MNKKQLISFVFIIAILLLVTFSRYYDYVLRGNFILSVNTVCNPNYEKCFIYDCSLSNDECDASPYKKVNILASDAPKCLTEHICEDFSCSTENCTIIYCSDDTVEIGEKCTASY